jgi:pimeloyl-ACP methyl ester carboxylesterase
VEQSLVERWARPWSRRRILRGQDHFSASHLKCLRSKLGEIQAPVLLIWGEQDNIFPLSHARRLLTGLPCSKLVTIPVCGHWSPVDAPAEVAHHLVAFLQSIEA